jgi:hypothetical protein
MQAAIDRAYLSISLSDRSTNAGNLHGTTATFPAPYNLFPLVDSATGSITGIGLAGDVRGVTEGFVGVGLGEGVIETSGFCTATVGVQAAANSMHSAIVVASVRRFGIVT